MTDTDMKWFIVESKNDSKVKHIVYASYGLLVQNKICTLENGLSARLLLWGDACHLFGAIIPPKVGTFTPVSSGLSIRRGDTQIFISVL